MSILHEAVVAIRTTTNPLRGNRLLVRWHNGRAPQKSRSNEYSALASLVIVRGNMLCYIL